AHILATLDRGDFEVKIILERDIGVDVALSWRTTVVSTPTAASTRSWNGLTFPTPRVFAIDSAHARAGFVARRLMVSKVRGGFSGVTGEITVAEDPTASSVTATIDATTIDTGQDDRDAHLKGADFLDVEKFPTLSFRSNRIESVDGNTFTLVGDLTIKDVTREVALEVEYEGVAVNPWGKEVI